MCTSSSYSKWPRGLNVDVSASWLNNVRSRSLTTVGRASRDARLQLARNALHEAVCVVFGHRQFQLDLRAVKRLLERDVDRDLIVLARNAHVAARPPPSRASREPREKVAEVDVLESRLRLAELLPPVWSRPEFLT